MWMLAVQNSDKLIYIWSLIFSIWTTRKIHDFQGYFSKTLNCNFQDFPGPGIFKKKIQDIPGGMETLKISK